MTEMATASEEDKLQSLQDSLTDWKHIIVEVDAWLRWEKDAYPYTMCAAVSFVYLVIWLLEPSILTSVSLVVMVVCLLDFLVPSVFQDYLNKRAWTEFKDERYKKFCAQLLSTQKFLVSAVSGVVDIRKNKPKYYFVGATLILLSIAFIGNAIPGLLLAYLLTIFLVLLPGLSYHGLLATVYAKVLQVFVDLVKGHRKKD